MNQTTEVNGAGIKKIVDLKITQTIKHFGGRHTTFKYNDGTECNVYSDFRPGIDNADSAKPLSDLKQAELEKRYKLKSSEHTMKTPTTAPVVNVASTKAVKPKAVKPVTVKKVVKTKTPAKKPAKPAKKAGTVATKVKTPRVDADAEKVIADFATNPLPAAFTEQTVHARLGRWNATIYRWVRANCAKTGERIAGKTAYALNAVTPEAEVTA